MSEIVPLARIKIDGGTQTRAGIRPEIVDEYAAPLEDMDFDLPEVVVFDDGKHLWMADGFHRYHGYLKAGRKKIPAKIRNGTVKDALLHSAGCNTTHGVRRSNEDKREAVRMILADEEWAKASNSWIAEKCKVSDHTVATVRAEMDGKSNTGQNGEESNATSQTRGCDNQASQNSQESTTQTATPKTVGKDGRRRSKPKPKPPANGTTDAAPAGNGEDSVREPDAEGYEIPDIAAPAFALQKDFNAACSALDRVVAEVKRLAESPAGRLTNAPSITQTIQQARKTLWSSRPTHVCPYCLGLPQKPACNCCKGEGWTNAATWKASPAGAAS